MQWPYRIILKLTDDEARQRRELLDTYGHFAQLSVLLIPLLIQITYGLQLIGRRALQSGSPKPTKARLSPGLANGHSREQVVRAELTALSKLRWQLGDRKSVV